jgi:murein DD-endopeptidase MepM/ murein hydrolase activator NlpD
MIEAMKRAGIVLGLLSAACATTQPAPISYGDNGAAPVPPSAPRTARTPPAPVADDAPLTAYGLQPDDVHPFDPANLPRTHRVGPNESLYDIAVTYQVPLRALIDQNNLQPPYAMSEGRVLRLPPPRFHTVATGERFEDIARRYNVDARSLALLNRLQPPVQVRRGDRLVLPAMARASAEPEPNPPPAPAPAPGVNARFRMPLRGEIVARFGAQPGGERLDGVHIRGHEGDAIMAAADGEVVYAGSDLAAYGVLILIRHADEYVTAYAYTRRALVREGERVRAGQPIAELGPRAGGARLMFQVRHGAAPVDPTPLLGL